MIQGSSVGPLYTGMYLSYYRYDASQVEVWTAIHPLRRPTAKAQLGDTGGAILTARLGQRYEIRPVHYTLLLYRVCMWHLAGSGGVLGQHDLFRPQGRARTLAIGRGRVAAVWLRTVWTLLPCPSRRGRRLGHGPCQCRIQETQGQSDGSRTSDNTSLMRVGICLKPLSRSSRPRHPCMKRHYGQSMSTEEDLRAAATAFLDHRTSQQQQRLGGQVIDGQHDELPPAPVSPHHAGWLSQVV